LKNKIKNKPRLAFLLFLDNCNMPVLYTWIEYLQSNLVELLQLFEEPNKIILTPLNNNYDQEKEESLVNKNACLFTDSESFIFEFLRFLKLKAIVNLVDNYNRFYILFRMQYFFSIDITLLKS
jgi:hypothetical protein